MAQKVKVFAHNVHVIAGTMAGGRPLLPGQYHACQQTVAISSRPAVSRLHACRAAGRHHDHRHSDRAAASGGAGGAGGGAAVAVHKQSQAIGAGGPEHESPRASAGWRLVVDVDRRSRSRADRHQPGGWIYNLLPQMEQDAIHDSQSGLTGQARLDAATVMCQTPLSMIYCPSRRPAKVYPIAWKPTYYFTNQMTLLTANDYAANAGDVYNVTYAGHDNGSSTPNSIAAAESAVGQGYFTAAAQCSTGISFPGSARIKSGMRRHKQHLFDRREILGSRQL